MVTITSTRKHILILIVEHTNNLQPLCGSEMKTRLFRCNNFVLKRHMANIFHQTLHSFVFNQTLITKAGNSILTLISLFHLSGTRDSSPKQVSCLNYVFFYKFVSNATNTLSALLLVASTES